MSSGQSHVHKFETDLIDEAASASGNRVPYQQLLDERNTLLAQAYIESVEKDPDPIFFFNQNRQMLHANAAAVTAIIDRKLEESIGLRLGELFGCDHQMHGEFACDEYKCHNCNSMPSLRAALDGHSASETKELVMHPDDSPARAVYNISAKPVSAGELRLAMLTFKRKPDSDVA